MLRIIAIATGMFFMTMLWTLTAVGFCFEDLKFVTEKDIISRVITEYMPEAADDVSTNGGQFEGEKGEYFAVSNWLGKSRNGGEFLVNTILLDRTFEVVAISELESPDPDTVYLRYLYVSPCGKIRAGEGYEMGRVSAQEYVSRLQQGPAE